MIEWGRVADTKLAEECGIPEAFPLLCRGTGGATKGTSA
jgi:hypothetical protein